MAPRGDGPLKLNIVRAPIAEVLPLCVGLVRAEHDGAVLVQGVTETPLAYHDARRHRADHHDLGPGFLVSTPAGRPDLTLIEGPPLGNLAEGLRRAAPELEVASIVSIHEGRSVRCHAFELFRDGARIRHAEGETGLRSGRWRWIEAGEPLPFEERDAYALRATSKRLDRARLLRYAAALGVDPARHLAGRDLLGGVMILGGQTCSAADDRPRTRAYPEAFARVLAAGIGQPDPSPEAHAATREWFRRGDLQSELRSEAGRRLRRMRKRTPERIAAWLDAHLAESEAALGPFADPFPLEGQAAETAARLDMAHPDTIRLRALADRWRTIRDLRWRLTQLLPDGRGHDWPSEERISRMVWQVLDAHPEDAAAREAALSEGFRALCATHGIDLGPAPPVPTASQARRASLGILLGGPARDATADVAATPALFHPGRS